MNNLKFRNWFLDNIKLDTISSVSKFNSMTGQICPYVLVINYKDGSVEDHEYYVKWQRNKDYLNLNLFLKRKGEKNDNQRVVGVAKGS